MRARRVARACRVVRQVVAPAGRHRPVEEQVPLAVLLRPEEAMVNDLAWCPAELRQTLHAFLRTGGRVCWTCRTVTTDPTPPGGVQ